MKVHLITSTSQRGTTFCLRIFRVLDADPSRNVNNEKGNASVKEYPGVFRGAVRASFHVS